MEKSIPDLDELLEHTDTVVIEHKQPPRDDDDTADEDETGSFLT